MNPHTRDSKGDKHGYSESKIRFSPAQIEFFLRKGLTELAESFNATLKACKKAAITQRFYQTEWDPYLDGTDPKHNPQGLTEWFTKKYPDKEFHIRWAEPQEFEVFRTGYKEKKYFEE